MKENNNTNKKAFSEIIKSNSIAFFAICIATVSLVIGIFSLVLIGVDSHNVLRFYPDGNGNYIVAVGDAKHLSEIVIPKRYKFGKVVGIDNEGFANCDKLTKIVIPDSVTEIGDNAFEYCISLEDVILGDGLKIIGPSAFYNCTSLKTITIPDGVTDIGEHAFTRCESLEIISIPESVSYIGALAFSENESIEFTEYEGACYLGNKENPYHTLVMVKNNGASSYSIHPSTKVIYSKAFAYCTSLTFIDIPDSVTCIGTEAFYESTSLCSIVIPKSLELISDRAFYGCDSLEEIYYTGKEESAYKIQVGSSNEAFSNAVVYCEYTRTN